MAAKRLAPLQSADLAARREWLDAWVRSLCDGKHAADLAPVGRPSAPLAPLPLPPPQPPVLAATLRHLEAPIDAGCVVHAARCGSYMYNLHCATSDEDYHFVYLARSAELLRPHAPADQFKRTVEATFAAADVPSPGRSRSRTCAEAPWGRWGPMGGRVFWAD